jgi:hypothetical protein
MKTNNKLIGMCILTLFLVSMIATPSLAAGGGIGGIFSGIGDLAGSIGTIFGKAADWVGKVASGEVSPGQAIGKLIGGGISGVITGVYNGLFDALEGIVKGTPFETKYLELRRTLRISLDEQYKLEDLEKELNYMSQDMDKIKKKITDAGCAEAADIKFEVTAATTPTTPTTGGGGRTSGMTAADRTAYNTAVNNLNTLSTKVMSGQVSRSEARRIARESAAVISQMRAKYPNLNL